MARNRIKKKKHNIAFSILVPLVSFVLIFSFFYYGIVQMAEANDRQQIDALETAVHRDIVHCYAAEGAYPPSLEYIEENYGLTYDHSRYTIIYEPVGVNILPDVTVMEVK